MWKEAGKGPESSPQARTPPRSLQNPWEWVILLASYKKPILYLQADLHKWRVSRGTLAPNAVHVVTDSMSPKYPAVHVTVTLDRDKPFIFNREQHGAAGK